MPITQLPIVVTFKRSRWLTKTVMAPLLLLAAVVVWPLMVLVAYWLVLGSLRGRKWRYILTSILIGPALLMQVFWLKPAWQWAANSATQSQATSLTADGGNSSLPRVQGASTSSQPSTKVLQVVSGDSFDVDQDGQAYRVKLIGLEAPATATESTPAACYGQESQSFLSSLLQGQPIQLTNDATLGDKDAQGRLLRYASLKDGTDINQLLLESGLARVDTSQPFGRQAEFGQLETTAKQSMKGMWAVCTPAVSVSPTPTPTPGIIKKASGK